MYILVVSFGTNWWEMHSDDTTDPLRFRRGAAFFNATALMSGHRLRHSALFPGQIRFNGNSGFDPQFPQRAVGKTFLSSGPRNFQGKTHLLFQRPAKGVNPDAYLVTIKSSEHGEIDFHSPNWKSDGVLPISVSSRADRYEAMLLFHQRDRIVTGLGRWEIDPKVARLVLVDDAEGVLL